MPWAPHFFAEKRGGFGVADDFLFDGIPLEFAADDRGDVAEVAGRLRAMSNFHRGEGALA